jgi:Secretion system C-terminal sorting domain/SprB repeat
MKKLFFYLLISMSLHTVAQNTCSLDVVIFHTLDLPTSEFFATVTNGTAPYTIELDGAPSPDDNIFYANKLSLGKHTVVVQDANGCVGSATFEVNAHHVFLEYAITNRSCIDGTTNVMLIAKDGVSPYEFSLNGSLFTSNPDFSNLQPGSYTAVVRDGLSSSNNTTIIIPPAVTSTVTVDKQIVTVVATGGIPPYQYSFDNGITFTSINSNIFNSSGTYSATVRDAYGCVVASNFVINATSLDLTATTTNALCATLSYGSITAIATGGQAPYSYYLDAVLSQTSGDFSNVASGIHVLSVSDAVGNTKTINLVITAPPALINTTTAFNQIITVVATGGTAPYRYSLDGINYDTNNTFAQPIGDYTTFILDANNCYSTFSFYKSPPPRIDGQTSAIVKLAPGKTLADIVVQGDNIKWYAIAGAPTSRLGKTSKKTAETPLPLTTVLEDGKTYYASQTIDGFESKQRLAVTVNLTVLATEDFVLNNFQFSPNPVKNMLSISNSSTIDEITITSELGKSILDKKINNLSSDIDLSELSNGVYFLKVKSEGKEKTVKILK